MCQQGAEPDELRVTARCRLAQRLGRHTSQPIILGAILLSSGESAALWCMFWVSLLRSGACCAHR